jgi:hypothetical protein
LFIDTNNVAVSSRYTGKRCITIIDIESQKVMTIIPMDTYISGMAVRGRTIYYCAWNKGLKKDPVLSLPIWNNSIPSLLMNLTRLEL